MFSMMDISLTVSRVEARYDSGRGRPRYPVPLMKLATSLLKRYKKRVSHVIADMQYYSAKVFKTVRGFGLNPSYPTHSR